MTPIELATCIYVYENAFKPANCIELLEQECKQEWGYVQWFRSQTGDDNTATVSSYRSSLGCELSPLFTNVQDIQVERVKPLAGLVQGISEQLENSVWHYRNSFNIDVTENEGYRILKYGSGAEYRGHVDHHQDNGRVFSLVGFMNDVEDGGELTFPLLDVTVKPKAGSVVFFPSNFPYFHYANPVGENSQEIKYSIVSWFR
jgi:hypothetical protein